MAKIIAAGTTTTTTYKVVEAEPNGTIRATFGAFVEYADDEAAREALAWFQSRTDRRGQTATSRPVMIKNVTATTTSFIV